MRQGPRYAALAGTIQKSIAMLDAGKEESYERNPGGVSFVFNHEVFKTFFENFASPSKLVSTGLARAAYHGPCQKPALENQ